VRRYGAEVRWLPFDLHPEYPPQGVPRRTLEGRRGKGFVDRVGKAIEDAGFRHAPPPVIPRSLRALALGELARDEGRHDDVHGRLFNAYWSEGRDIGDLEVLTAIGVDAGLDADVTRDALESGTLVPRVRQSSEAAQQVGVDAVPAWLIDKQLLVLGAQPHEVLDNVMAKLGHAPLDDGGGPEA
jgi:predicted DsbA family dithiol-disulfide isomerase